MDIRTWNNWPRAWQKGVDNGQWFGHALYVALGKAEGLESVNNKRSSSSLQQNYQHTKIVSQYLTSLTEIFSNIKFSNIPFKRCSYLKCNSRSKQTYKDLLGNLSVKDQNTKRVGLLLRQTYPSVNLFMKGSRIEINIIMSLSQVCPKYKPLAKTECNRGIGEKSQAKQFAGEWEVLVMGTALHLTGILSVPRVK